MFFDVIVKPQTWKNAGYLLVAFPLGIFYFVFLVTGLSLGAGLAITLLGIPILVLVLTAAHGMGEFERILTNAMLDQDTPPVRRGDIPPGLWEQAKSRFRNANTWKRVAYLFADFPLGIVGFTLVVTTLACFALIATPLFYVQDWWVTTSDWPFSWWIVDSLWESFVIAILGVLVGLVLLHIVNGLARAWSGFAGMMLGPSQQIDATGSPPPSMPPA